MTQLTVRTSLTYKKETIKYYELFGYSLVKEDKPSKLGLVKLYFSSEHELSNEQKMIMERNKIKNELPFWPLPVVLGIGIIFATLFLIMCFADKNTDKLVYFATFMVPAVIFITCGSLYSILRHIRVTKNIEILVALHSLENEISKK